MNEAIRVSLISLGCARNLVDSEVLLGHAVEEGLAIAPDPKDADVVVINTCGFVEAAKQESIDAILGAARLKEEGRIKGVVAVGCLAQRYATELAHELPEVDAILGISDYSGVPSLIRQIVNGSARRWVATVDGGRPKMARNDVGRVLLTPKSYAYLRISEGCDHGCAFCAIPGMRGRNRSKPMDVLVEEAEALAAQGVVELVVVAEDTTAYGLDLDRRRQIHVLLERLAAIPAIRWIRLMYAYPHTVGKELTRVLRECDKVVPYLDIPIQHISTKMLRAMRRGVSSQQVEDILWRLREEVPGIAVRTTLISGFPGETDADHDEVLRFVERYRFERLGVFTYSAEEGTAAFDLPGAVDPDLAEQRRAEIMTLQQGFALEQNRAWIGCDVPVLIDGRHPDAALGEQSWVGRTERDAPEVDGTVLIESAALQPGDLVLARVVDADDYDLVARVQARPDLG